MTDEERLEAVRDVYRAYETGDRALVEEIPIGDEVLVT